MRWIPGNLIALLFAALAALWLTALSGCGEDRADDDAVTLFAAASTIDAITEIAASYPGEVRLSFNASSTAAKQIEAGAAADVVLLANPYWMDHLAELSLIDADSRTDLLSNTLVLIEPASGTSTVSFSPGGGPSPGLSRWLPDDARIAIGDPGHVPAGMYAVEALRELDWYGRVADALITTVDVRAAVRLVEQGEAAFGIVYGSDAAGNADVRVVATFPADLHEPIQYPIALTARAKPESAGFMAHLQSPDAARVFAKHGFLIRDDAGQVVSASETTAGVERAESVWPIIWLSIKVAVACVLFSAVPGVFCGWLLARKRFFGKTLVDALIHLPLVVPPVAVGYVLLVLLGRGSAFGGWLHDSLGLDIAFTWYAAVIASAVMGFPLLVRAVRLSIEMSDRNLEQAAGTLGTSPGRVFFTITLPLAMPGVLTGLILAFARSLGEFGATITFAGDMGGDTRTLPLAMYRYSQTPGGDSAAVQLILISVAIALAALVVSEVLARRMAKRLGAQA